MTGRRIEPVSRLSVLNATIEALRGSLPLAGVPKSALQPAWMLSVARTRAQTREHGYLRLFDRFCGRASPADFRFRPEHVAIYWQRCILRRSSYLDRRVAGLLSAKNRRSTVSALLRPGLGWMPPETFQARKLREILGCTAGQVDFTTRRSTFPGMVVRSDLPNHEPQADIASGSMKIGNTLAAM